jgi:NADPH2:quinone reductase
MKAIRIHKTGGPEVLSFEDVEDPVCGADQVLIRTKAVGLNYIDTYHRTGLYPVALPFTPGLEAAGVVEQVGGGVSGFVAGDRVAYGSVLASYAEKIAAPASSVVPLPDGVDFATGAAAMLQGITAHYLTHSTFPLGKGHTILIHAAAGGVGLLLVQIAKRLGARVLGTVGSAEKETLARGAGADEVIRYSETDFEAEVRRLTEGSGVDVVYDSVGQATFDKSLNCLKPRGYCVLFGQSSGSVPPFDPAILNQKGSLFLTRPTMMDYISTREDLLARTGDVLGWIASGELNLRIDRQVPLAEAAEAHRALEGRQTKGKVILIP